jgi:hypothetical protein
MKPCKLFSKKSNLPNVPETEILEFYQMLVKMKKRHSHLNPQKMIHKLYPYFEFKK